MKFWHWIIIVISIVALVYLAMLFSAHWKSNPDLIAKVDSENPFISSTSMVSAHRIGGGDAPEETMAALEKCLSSPLPPEVLEIDLRLTSDDTLVLFHDETLDRTTDSPEIHGEGKRVGDMPLSLLKALNMGENFQDKEGNYPYRGLRGDDVPDTLRIMTLEEFLDRAEEEGDFFYIMEIKDKGERGMAALDQLHSILEERDLLSRTILGTFNKEITQYRDSRYPDIIRSASVRECLGFYFSALLGLKNYEPKFSVLQVFYGRPYFKYGINMATAKVINYAHSHDIAIQYWTVNDTRDMDYLFSVRADAVITDYV
ncbi:MAG: glycerophosphodiester phosphodiesterase family protein, partial [Candidatus Ornithospirochaeta sp.]